MLRTLINRPRLSGAFVLGAAVSLALSVIPNPLRWSTRAVFAWDTTLIWFIGSTLLMMCSCDETQIRARANKEDEGPHIVLALAVFAACAAVVAIGFELSIAKNEHGLARAMRTALAFVTVFGSWFFVQMVFALHYAHEYYGDPDGEGPIEKRGGLAFPGDEAPDYWDFLHFGAIIGVAAQTADVAFTSRAMRRTGTVHAMVSFLFNTVVLALTINLLAGLF
jgi:uncharacterized membrane protein